MSYTLFRQNLQWCKYSISLTISFWSSTGTSGQLDTAHLPTIRLLCRTLGSSSGSKRTLACRQNCNISLQFSGRRTILGRAPQFPPSGKIVPNEGLCTIRSASLTEGSNKSRYIRNYRLARRQKAPADSNEQTISRIRHRLTLPTYLESKAFSFFSRSEC